MFYLKSKQPNGKVVETEITDENVFTRCPECGAELPIDLAELFADGDGALYSVSIVCSACTVKRNRKRRFTDDIEVTLDALMMVSYVLHKAGYSEQLSRILEKYDIELLSELEPKRYKSFAEAVINIATEGGDI